MSIAVFQHADAEGPALLGEVLDRRGIPWRLHPFHRGAPVPASLASLEALEGCRGLIVLGGPMGACEEEAFPWLGDEVRFLGEALRAGFPVYGLCLGGQLMARALGARVYPGKGPKEIGWFAVSLAPGAGDDPLLAGEPAAFPVFQWHGDTFDLPAGAALLAASERYPHQAFRFGRAGYAFQFHLEVREADIRAWLEAFSADLASPRSDADPAAIAAGAKAHLGALNRRAERLFGRWLALAGLGEGLGEGVGERGAGT